MSCKAWFAAGSFYHINFKAKSKNADPAHHSLQLFFAELRFFLDGFTVRKCCIVEPKDAGIYTGIVFVFRQLPPIIICYILPHNLLF